MIIYFANRRLDILGQASTSLPAGIKITDDSKVDEIDYGCTTFEFSFGYTKENRMTVNECVSPGNYIFRKNGIEYEFYTIITSEDDSDKSEVKIYAEDAGLDLLNEVVGPYEATQALSIASYINLWIADTGFEIGINEVSNLTRTLEWSGEETVTARLLSVATQFDNAEISYSFDIERLRVTKKYINIHKKRVGTSNVELRLNRDINSITTKKSVENLATALIVKGGTPEGAENPITLAGYRYDDGDIYVDGTYLKSRSAVAKWSRYLFETGNGEGHIVKTFTYDTIDQAELCARAITELKKIYDVEINYEVDIAKLPTDVKIGDTITIVDRDVELYLTARVLKLETSITNNTRTATLGDYLIKESSISQSVLDLANEFKNIAKNRTLYTWTAYADDEHGTGATLDPTGKSYLGTADNRVSKEVDITDPSIFKWVRVQGEDGKDGKDGKDGDDGNPTYLHVAYADDDEGNGFSKSPKDKSHMGTYSDFEMEDSDDPSMYTWIRVEADTTEIKNEIKDINDNLINKQDILLTSIRYIRDWLNGSDHDTVNGWVELEAFVGDENVAAGLIPKGKNKRLTEVQVVRPECYTDGLLIDTDEEETDNFATIENTGWHCLEIDLGAVRRDIDYIQVWHYYPDNRACNHKLQISTDGNAWVTVYDSEHSGGYAETPAGRVYYTSNMYLYSTNTDIKQEVKEATNNITAINDDISSIKDKEEEIVTTVQGISDAVEEASDSIVTLTQHVNELSADVIANKTEIIQTMAEIINRVGKVEGETASLSEIVQDADGWKALFAKLNMYDMPNIQTNITLDINGMTVENPETGQKTIVSTEEFAGYFQDQKVFYLNEDELRVKRVFVENGIDTNAIKLTPVQYTVGDQIIKGLAHVKSNGVI